MRRLQGLLLLIAAASTAACMPFGLQRSRARVSEIETTSRYSGTNAATIRTEIDYLSDGRVEEMTRTSGGDFLDRWELSYDESNRVEELVMVSDASTIIVQLSYTGDLLTEATAQRDDSDEEMRWDLSYHNGDARFIESVVLTVDSPSVLSEVASQYSYDDSSRIEQIATSAFHESSTGNTSESTSTDELRYDADSGRLERVTTTTETPYYTPAQTDTCWDSGYYGDGVCDSFCLQPDPDCSGVTTQPVAPSQGEPEIVKNTYLYSVEYDDEGRLEEMDGPDGETISVEYDADERIEQVEQRNEGYTITTEYTYDEGEVRGHSFSPAMPNGELFDLVGASFGTVALENPLSIVGTIAATAGPSAGSDSGF